MSDERPRCTLLPPSAGPSTCYCTGRPGCQSPRGESEDVVRCVDCSAEFTSVDPNDEVCADCNAAMAQPCPHCGRPGVHTCKGPRVTGS